MNKLLIIILSLYLAGCVTGEKMSRINPGMSPEEVTHIMGKPDGFKQADDYVIYKYTDRFISGWSPNKTDYSFIFKNDKLVEYGAGEVREQNVGGVHSVFIYQM